MKRIFQFDHFFLMTSTLLILSGCGANKDPASTTFSTSAIIAATRDLTVEERTIATRICYAYQSKNANFKLQTYYGATFNFNMSYKECNDSTKNYSVAGVLTSSPSIKNALIYSTDTSDKFNSSVQTYQTGFLAQLCYKIQNNLAISNTAVESGNTIQVAFTSGAIDSYTLQYFTTSNGQSKINTAETFKVRTQFNIAANQILGMDETYTKQQVCSSDKTKYTELNQVFSDFLKK